MNNKKNTPLLISAIIGVAYTVYLMFYFFGATQSDNQFEAAAGAVATAIVLPHLIFVGVAAIFNVLSWLKNNHTFALIGAILYCVGAVLFFFYAIFVLPMIILSFVGYSKLKKLNKSNG